MRTCGSGETVNRDVYVGAAADGTYVRQHVAFGASLTTANYDVSQDGQRFVMVKDESGSGRLNVVLNWLAELKARVPAK